MNVQKLDDVIDWISNISTLINANETLFSGSKNPIQKTEMVNDVLKNQRKYVQIIKSTKNQVDWSESRVRPPIYWASFDDTISKITKELSKVKNGQRMNKHELEQNIKMLMRNVISMRNEIERINSKS